MSRPWPCRLLVGFFYWPCWFCSFQLFMVVLAILGIGGQSNDMNLYRTNESLAFAINRLDPFRIHFGGNSISGKPLAMECHLSGRLW